MGEQDTTCDLCKYINPHGARPSSGMVKFWKVKVSPNFQLQSPSCLWHTLSVQSTELDMADNIICS